jgi:glycosyltransferase involved in cell wall biosynthesis
MPPWPTLLAAIVLVLWLGVAWEVMRGNRSLRRLATLPLPKGNYDWPRVSLIFTARNEGKTLGAAVPTMLALDYPDLEIIAVNDRSEDETGAVLDGLATRDPRLRVFHVKELAAGWLGKTHGLQLGGENATGEWFLFTDADIHFQPDVLRRAIAHARGNTLDHLAVLPQLHERGTALGVCVGAFSLVFALFIRPWRVIDARSACHGGVGAFNLVRASTYKKLDGHEPLRLRPDDDIKLGKLMKAGGFSEMMLGAGAVSVAWYASVGDFIRGLTKNAFAGADYRVWFILVGVAAHLGFFIGPIVALFFAVGAAWWLALASGVVMLGVAVDNQRFNGGKTWHGLLFPLGLLVLDFVLLRSMVVTLVTRGITWRGTHYPLAALKKNRL